MAFEVVGRNERVILVQVNTKTGDERALYKDDYGGGFQPTTNVAAATDFETKEKADKLAEMLNMLYSMTGNVFKAHSVSEVVERKFLDKELTDNVEKESETTERDTNS